MNKIKLDILIPIIVVIAFFALSFTGVYDEGENGIYDLYLHLKPELQENESILLLNIDDLAIAKVGMYPWSRNILADGLILMKEFEAAYTVFDIEFTEESPRGVNSDLLEQEIPEFFLNEFTNIDENMKALFGALAAGAISLQDAEDYVRDLSGLTQMSMNLLLEKVQEISRDNDAYMGQAVRYFDHAFLTINMLPEEDPDVAVEVKEYAHENHNIKKVRFEGFEAEKGVDIRPAILPLTANARGLGFPNIIVDTDGVRRRVNLVMQYKDRYFGQLAFSPLLDWLGNPEVVLNDDSIHLIGASHPTEGIQDIEIPLTEKGRLLINWPKKIFEESYRQLSYYYLVLHGWQEDRLIHNLKIMEQAGYLGYYEGEGNLLDSYRYADSIKQDVLEGDDLDQLDMYRQTRTYFFDELAAFLSGNAEAVILSEVDDLLASEELPEEYKESYMEIRSDVVESFANTRDLLDAFSETRNILREQLPGSFCIVGWTGTATTDIGVNPFDEEYDNVGTHASVINTILQGAFLDDVPWWYSAIIAAVLAFVVYFIIRRLNPGLSMVIGVIFIILIVGGGIGFFYITGIYVPIINPLLSIVITFLSMTVVKFLQTAREKSFIRNAFGHYLSTDVINDLIDNPDKLALGGEKKELTAIFTDVKGFSSISEVLDPTDLVRLLNMYLTEMSDTIMDLRGTIDKYEGDAIISFFGAPVEFDDHARRACEAAVRMKKVEQELNKRFLQDNLTPNPLLTRIGVNTGEMVVGNMGTAQKMDYTIMGNAVNLAARLEGVNKQYGTWILISDATCAQVGDDFVTRKLDRVRVVGIQEPVRLYELLDTRQDVDSRTAEGVEEFHKAIELFENKNWEGALAGFEKVLESLPDDGPATTFIKRCRDYIRKPPAAGWDGVFNLSMK